MYKIVFICSSIEPGKDGVGDYTRRLASEMQVRGVKVLVVALNDPYVLRVTEEFQEGPVENVKIQVVRFNNFVSYVQDIKLLIEKFKPKLISLQLVLFGFHKKGIPFFLNRHLKKVLGDYDTQIMVHELWAGLNKHSTFKLKLFGVIQKYILINLLKSIKSSTILTHTPLYQKELLNSGIETIILPLFSNIIHYKSDKEIKKNPELFNVLLFGTVKKSNKIKNFLSELKSNVEQHNKKLMIEFLGRNGIEINDWIDAIKELNIDYIVSGFVDGKEISLKMQRADLGISTTMYPLSTKSGVVAAMLEHNLSIICVSEEFENRNCDNINLLDIINYSPNKIEWSSLFRIRNQNKLISIFDEYLHIINKS